MAGNGLMRNLIHITNIPWTVGCQELGLHFSQFGCLTTAFVAFDHKTGFHQGYGHVAYFKKEDMENTINREHILEGNRLVLSNQYEGDLSATDLEKTFNRAAAYLQTLVLDLQSGQLLGFYGLYKQATVGPCDVPRPNWYQVQAKHKWEAWKNLGDMSRETAMINYIHAIAKINPSWEEEAKAETSGWTSVSKLPKTEEELEDADKTFLDWIKEGNEAKVREILSGEPTLVNTLDEDGLLPIHWAADRGHVGIVEYLIENGANVNSQDQDGQTPLHYAASCGHAEAVKYLLSIGAQSIADNDGMTPKDVAEEQLAALL